MSVEYLAEKIFFKELVASGQLWVARSVYHNIYAVELDQHGVSLPVWSSRERVVDFLQQARLVGPKYQPDAVSVEVFTTAWLGDQRMAIAELQLNPDGKSHDVRLHEPVERLAKAGRLRHQ